MSKELALALGLNVSTARLGSVAGSYLLPSLWPLDKAYSPHNSFLPLIMCCIICAASFCMGLGLNFMDKKAED